MPTTVKQAIEQATFMLNNNNQYCNADWQMVYGYVNYFYSRYRSSLILASLVNQLKEKLK